MSDTTSLLNFNEIANGYTYTILAAISLPILNYFGRKILYLFSGRNFNFYWKERTIMLDQLINAKTKNQITSRLKILLIDNEESVDIELFKEDGYNIEYWNTVKNLKQLLDGYYDIIILDIRDVAKHLSPEDGFGVLKTIKENNPSQVMIAYSAYSYDLSKKKFWDLADEAIDKPTGYLEMKRILDNVIITFFNPQRILKLIRDKFQKNNITAKDERIFEKHIVSKINSDSVIHIDNELYMIQDEIEKKQIWNMLLSYLTIFTDYEYK